MSATGGSRSHPRVFYGWYMVLAGALAMCFAHGFMFFAYATFFTTWENEFGWSRGLISTAFSAGLITSAVAAPVVGRVADTLGPKWAIGTGALILGAGMLLLGQMNQVWQLYVYTLVLAIGFSCMGAVPVGVLVSRWFIERRGLALGITQVGIGIGGLLMAQLAATLIEALDWGRAFVVLGILVWVVMLPLTLFISSRPEDKGLLPDGKRFAPSTVNKGNASQLTLGASVHEAVRTWQFWGIAFIVAVTAMTANGVYSQIRPLMDDLGFSLRVAAIALGIVGATNALGKLMYGYIAQRTSVRVFLIIGVFGNMTVPASILLVTGLGAPREMIFLTPVLDGALTATLQLLPTLMIASVFGLRHMGALMGIMIACESLGQGLGPAILGNLFDITGNYNAGALLFVGVLILALVVPIITSPKKREEQSV